MTFCDDIADTSSSETSENIEDYFTASIQAQYTNPQKNTGIAAYRKYGYKNGWSET